MTTPETLIGVLSLADHSVCDCLFIITTGFVPELALNSALLKHVTILVIVLVAEEVHSRTSGSRNGHLLR